jgi:hypothetical protein
MAGVITGAVVQQAQRDAIAQLTSDADPTWLPWAAGESCSDCVDPNQPLTGKVTGSLGLPGYGKFVSGAPYSNTDLFWGRGPWDPAPDVCSGEIGGPSRRTAGSIPKAAYYYPERINDNASNRDYRTSQQQGCMIMDGTPLTQYRKLNPHYGEPWRVEGGCEITTASGLTDPNLNKAGTTQGSDSNAQPVSICMRPRATKCHVTGDPTIDLAVQGSEGDVITPTNVDISTGEDAAVPHEVDWYAVQAQAPGGATGRTLSMDADVGIVKCDFDGDKLVNSPAAMTTFIDETDMYGAPKGDLKLHGDGIGVEDVKFKAMYNYCMRKSPDTDSDATRLSRCSKVSPGGRGAGGKWSDTTYGETGCCMVNANPNPNPAPKDADPIWEPTQVGRCNRWWTDLTQMANGSEPNATALQLAAQTQVANFTNSYCAKHNTPDCACYNRQDDKLYLKEQAFVSKLGAKCWYPPCATGPSADFTKDFCVDGKGKPPCCPPQECSNAIINLGDGTLNIEGNVNQANICGSSHAGPTCGTIKVQGTKGKTVRTCPAGTAAKAGVSDTKVNSTTFEATCCVAGGGDKKYNCGAAGSCVVGTTPGTTPGTTGLTVPQIATIAVGSTVLLAAAVGLTVYLVRHHRLPI